MFQDFFKFPLGTEVELTLSRNRIFDNLVLKGVVLHYFQRPGWQTVLQNKKVKHYPVSLVQVETEYGKLVVDVDCIITKPTQKMIDEADRIAEAINMEKAKAQLKKSERPRKRRDYIPAYTAPAPTTCLGDKMATAGINLSAITWLYVASKNSKVFHNADSSMAKRIADGNLVKFKDKAEAEASGRKYAGK